MNDLNYISDEIKLKVVKLLQKVEALEKDCKTLKEQNQMLENTLQEQKNTISALEETNKMLKIAGILDQPDDNRELKKLVNGYIKEIDECLKLLSNR
jgi:predicted  nucleic acid-binding Zn-ribbon protein